MSPLALCLSLLLVVIVLVILLLLVLLSSVVDVLCLLMSLSYMSSRSQLPRAMEANKHLPFFMTRHTHGGSSGGSILVGLQQQQQQQENNV